MNKQTLWKVVAATELVIATLVILLDLFIPTIVILGVIAISLLIRREGLSTLGFKAIRNVPGMAADIFLWVVVWTLLHLSLTMPLLNRLTGTTQDLSAFANLQGNVGELLVFLALTWTLAAFGEEIVYRRYFQRRVSDLVGSTEVRIFLAVGLSSLLFGLAHTEQGVIGVVLTFMDALFFSWIKRRHGDNLWASILAHGFNNTIGIIAFFFVGPIYGFW